MVGPLRFDGLTSGIDFARVIDTLLSIQSRPVKLLETRVKTATSRRAALLEVNAALLAFKSVADTLARPSFWNATRVSSSNESVISASGSAVGSLGAFTFAVRRLAQSHQMISNGFADATSTPVTAVASSLSIELGGGFLERRTATSFLNAQTGFDRGSVRITDSAGRVGVVNLEGAVTVQDVLDEISNATSVSVRASAAGNRIVVQDLAGGPGTLQIENFGADTTATTLGIAGTAVAVGPDQFVLGSDINTVGASTRLAFLNDGLGARSVVGDDLRIILRNGTTFIDVDLDSGMTLGQVLAAINGDSQNPGTLAASLAGNSLVLTDTSLPVGRTADAPGTNTTVIELGELAGVPTGLLVGAQITMTGGTPLNIGQVRTVTAYDAGTGTITLDAPLPDVTAAGDTYVLERGTTIQRLNNSFAAVDLGLGVLSGSAFVQVAPELSTTGAAGPVLGNRIVGSALTPSLNTTLRTLLNGGQTNLTPGDPKGVADGLIAVTDRLGAATAVNVSRRVATTGAAAAAGATSLDLVAGGSNGFAAGNRVRVQTAAGIEFRTVTAIDAATDTISFDQGLAGAYAAGNDVSALNDSLEDIVRAINGQAAAAGVGVRVEAHPRGNALRVVDTTGASVSNLIVTGAPATGLGIATPALGVAAASVEGTDLDPQYLGETTALASMNGGQGVARGRLRVMDTFGLQFDVDLTQADDTTLGEVIREINAGAAAAGSGVTARINDTGDGILLVDGAVGGTQPLRVLELDNGRTARDLNIAGTAPSATPNAINGTFEFSIAIQAGATLQGVADAINARGLAVTAAVINDGSPINPFKLTLLSRRSGAGGRMTVGTAIPGLSFSTTAAAQDAVLVYGSNGGPMDPTVVTSSQNTVTNVVPGLTLQLRGTSSSPVTVTVSRDTDAIQRQGQAFVDRYNEAILKIREHTFFNPETSASGALFADPTVRIVRGELARQTLRPVAGLSPADLNSLAEVGIRAAAEGALSFDASKFSSALASNFDQAQTLFILQRKLEIGTLVKDLGNGRGVSDAQGPDFTVRARNGTTVFNVDIAGAATIGSLLQAINAVPGNPGVIAARIAADGFSIELVDASVIPPRMVAGAPTVTTFTAAEADITGTGDTRIVGSTITFTGGPNAGEIRKVAAYDPVTFLVTLDSALPVAPGLGDGYTLERELEVFNLPVATAASELGIARKLALGQNALKGTLLNLNNDPGVAARLSERLDLLTRRGDGLISTRTQTLDDTIKGLNASIDRIEARLEDLRERLVRQFAGLEVALAQSQSTLQRLQASLTGFLSLVGSGGGA